MKFYNLSKHGALTGCLILTFFVMMSILAASKIHDLEVLTEKYKDFQEFPPQNEDDWPTAVLVVSLIMIVITGLMVVGVLKEHHLLMAPWIIIFIIVIIGQAIYYVHEMLPHFNLNMFSCFSCLIGVQILILSPIIILFDDIRCKHIEDRTKNELNHQ